MNKMKAAAGLVLLLSLVFAGCQNPGDDKDDFNTTLLLVGTQYDNVAISAFGTNFYRFAAAGSGAHTVALTNLTSDMSWMLFQNPSLTDPGILQDCDDYLDQTAETDATVALTAGKVYYLAVDEWDILAGSFSLIITFP